MTLLPKRSKTPQERVSALIERFELDLPERPVGVWIADLQLLNAIATEAEAQLRNRHPDYDNLCALLGQFRGVADGHEWEPWEEPYLTARDEWWTARMCSCCGTYRFKQVDAPTDQDGAS